MKKEGLLSLVLLFISTIAFSQVANPLSINDTLSVKATLIHSEDFNSNLSKWVKEIQPSENSEVSIKDGKLDNNVGAGCSVWDSIGRIISSYLSFFIQNDLEI